VTKPSSSSNLGDVVVKHKVNQLATHQEAM
jgi:hypothetical protein